MVNLTMTFQNFNHKKSMITATALAAVTAIAMTPIQEHKVAVIIVVVV